MNLQSIDTTVLLAVSAGLTVAIYVLSMVSMVLIQKMKFKNIKNVLRAQWFMETIVLRAYSVALRIQIAIAVLWLIKQVFY